MISKDNPTVKMMISLQNKKGRMEHGAFIAEGVRLVADLLSSGFIALAAFYSEDVAVTGDMPDILAKISRQTGKVFMVDELLMKKLCDTKTNQGIVVAFQMSDIDSDEFIKSQPKNIFVVSGISDPGNLGTIIRSAAASGMDGILIESGSVELYNPKVVRSTMGAIGRLPIFTDMSSEEIGEFLKIGGYDTYIADANGDTTYYDLPVSNKLAIVLGSEARGVSEYWQDGDYKKVYIPQKNQVESLNVAMAATIICFDIFRRG